METIILITISIILPVWIYLWFTKNRREQLQLYYLDYDIPFILKRWWATWNISRERNQLDNNYLNVKLKNILEPSADNPKIIMDENNCDSIFFYGADQKGNSLFVKMNHRGYHMAELALQLTLADGRIYMLPDNLNIVITNRRWSASDLKIEFLESRQRWRILYNGLLRNQCKGNTPNDDNMEHIRLNFIFMGHSKLLKWPEDWSIHLHADALAHEPWKDPDWKRKIELIDYTGFDLWGSAIGQITFQDSSTTALYLRGFCQRRWGKHESYQFHQIVTFFGVTTNGAMYYLGASKTKHSFSHMQFGHIHQADEIISNIDWMDLKLNDFEKRHSDNTLKDYNITFTAAGKKYNAVINRSVIEAMISYNGQPWCWVNKNSNLHVQLNGNKGVGLMLMSYPYTGPKQAKIPFKKIHLKCVDTLIEKNKYIVYFDEQQCQNENFVGGKGCSLAILSSIATNDFIVPQGFCVTSFALEWQLQHHKQLQDMIADIVDITRGRRNEDLKNYCEKVISAIENTPIEEQIKQAILDALKRLETPTDIAKEKTVCNRYAVRSSAIGEDSEETSAAGQNSTYLGVTNADDIVRSVVKCWASLFSYQSVEYRRQNGLPIKASMGVCVQKMVDAEAAGVMFTRHPTTGDPSSIIITANYGLGETVVSGMVEPDTLIIHRSWDNTLTLSNSILGNKEQKISLNNDGVTTTILNEQQREKMSISETIALHLANTGVYLESYFESARDVEFAIVGKEIFLLQARPITTINTWTDFELTHELDTGVPCDTDVLTFANVGEVFPNPISPLSLSSIIKILCLAVNQIRYKDYECTHLHMIGMRCVLNYFNTALRDVAKDITMSNKMLDFALCGGTIITPEIHNAAVEKYGTISAWRALYLSYDMFKKAWNNKNVVKEATKIYNGYVLDANEFHTAHDLHDIINKKYAELYTMGIYHCQTSNISVVYQMLAMSLLTRGSRDFTSDHLADIAILLSSCTNVISSEVPVVLGKIAACIRENGKAEAFSKIEPTEAIDWLEVNCLSAADKLRAFFDKHGYRCIQELDLISEPWIFKPDNIITTIQTLAISLEDKHMSKALSAEETVASLKTPTLSSTKWLLKKIIPFSREAIRYREITKAMIVSMVHTLRVAYRRLGMLMVMENYIPDENLIFFLTHVEIGQLLENQNPVLIRKAFRRKKIYYQLGKLKYPEFTTGMPMPIEDSFDATSYKGNATVDGTSVCGGSILGRACVITDLSQAKTIQQGDILITHCTDIGWSPYFPLLGGIVTELGGLISHGAVVAREYGLPCIVGAKRATQIFQTGDVVLLAGDLGVLKLIKTA